MPQYDYRCNACRQTFTIERSMTDSSEPECAHCQSADVSRIWNLFVVGGPQTQDVGQGASSGQKRKSGCGSCSSHSCGTCH